MENEGAGVLYSGIGVKTLHSLAQSFVYFYAFASLRRAWEARLARAARSHTLPVCAPPCHPRTRGPRASPPLRRRARRSPSASAPSC